MSLSKPISAPKIPFRKHASGERQAFWDYARELKIEVQDEFWKQTIPVAQGRVEFLRRYGYVLSGDQSWGNEMDGYGVKVIMSRCLRKLHT
ncbi:MAG: hypothetical protein KJ718_02185 [Nanoarchaeota archaeon]|nr:hypothetical protein [Nanoarchaeota archaeon]MBU1051343.1 hypothetical protein [Nanoarchaeota archaeon]MBU1988404.1 hypothetical protein [Nanoarchaeota archaeon]